MTRQLRPSEHCLNCGHAGATRFCPECGQENTNYRVSLGRLLGDLFEELFQLESRLWRTLWTLFRRPGLLTVEYNAGRRVRYTTPLRLYLLASVTYFFVGSIMPSHSSKVHLKLEGKDQVELQKGLDELPANGWGRRLLERFKDVARDPETAGHHAEQVVAEWIPRLMAVMVPSFALLTMLFFRRPKRFYVEHLVYALHLHAAAFFLLTLIELVDRRFIVLAMMVALIAVYALSARRVFGQSWWRLLWKLPLVSQLYSLTLGVGFGIVFLFGLLWR